MLSKLKGDKTMAVPNWSHVSIERAKPGSLVTAAAPAPDQLHLYVTAVNGSIHSTSRDPASGVWASWLPVTGGEAALGSPITAVARIPYHLDLFVTAPTVRSTRPTGTSGRAGPAGSNSPASRPPRARRSRQWRAIPTTWTCS